MEYLRFDRPPLEEQSLDTLIVMGTSRLLSPISFDLRVSTLIDYANKSPEATIIFSGKQAGGNKAHPQESGPQYIEAAVMAKEAMSRGLDPQRVKLETKAINAKENVIHSVEMLSPEDEHILFVSSDYLARRIDLYLEKMKQLQTLPTDKQFYLVDADVREDATKRSFTLEQMDRKQKRLLYEFKRIPLYRAKGDLV
jgi:uncharacterized SAM-binding protein YcdF (DUF218 family)